MWSSDALVHAGDPVTAVLSRGLQPTNYRAKISISILSLVSYGCDYGIWQMFLSKETVKANLKRIE